MLFIRHATKRSAALFVSDNVSIFGDVLLGRYIPKRNPLMNVTFGEDFSNSTKNTKGAWCEPFTNSESQIFQLEAIVSEVPVHSIKNSL